MKKILKQNKSSILLLSSIILGTLIGLIFKEKASVLSPFGDLFLNLLLVIIIPLIFTNLTLSIAKMSHPKRIEKILKNIFIVFILTSLVSAFSSLIITKSIKLIDNNNLSNKIVLTNTEESEDINILNRIVNSLSVNDFTKLLSKENLIALIVFSIIIGICINIKKDKLSNVINTLDQINIIIKEYINILMYYAPVGLGCYFASLVGTFGKELALGFTKTFIIYLITSLFFYFVIYSIYAYISGGKKVLKAYWKNIIPASITALGTCSSAASIPINQECTKKMGVSNDIADTTIALGTNFHKDGSIIGSVFKIMFLVNLFNLNVSTLKIIIIALVATLLIVAVPIGGGSISETLIVSMLGVNPSNILLLTIIATIIDAPATLLNVVGDSASSLLVSKITDGKIKNE